jgi:nucleotide-binding universal stress UspA family protein
MEVLEGDAKSMLGAFAEQKEVDYVVVGCSSASGGMLKMGSVSNYLLKNCAVPTIVIRTQKENQIFSDSTSKPIRFLVAMDGSSYAQLALDRAIEMAQPGRNDLIKLLCIAHQDGTSKKTADDLVRDHQLAKEILAKAEDYAKSKTMAQVRVTSDVMDGDPRYLIIAAAKVSADFVLMGNRGTTGQAAFGSVSDYVSKTSEIPVIVLQFPNKKE